MTKITSRNSSQKGKITKNSKNPQKMAVEIINNDESYKIREVSDDWQNK